MENVFCCLAFTFFLTDIGLLLGTLWHVNAMVFNMSSNFVQLFFTFKCFCTFRVRPGGRTGGKGGTGGTSGRAGGRGSPVGGSGDRVGDRGIHCRRPRKSMHPCMHICVHVCTYVRMHSCLHACIHAYISAKTSDEQRVSCFWF